MIFSASLSGSDDIILFDAGDGNRALFAHVLCDIIYIFFAYLLPIYLGVLVIQDACKALLQITSTKTHKI